MLTAAEVRRLHKEEATVEEPTIHRLLVEFVGLDPTQEEQRLQAHLFVLARPLGAGAEMLQDAVGDEWQSWTTERVLGAPPA
jgi:hypothetical protein